MQNAKCEQTKKGFAVELTWILCVDRAWTVFLVDREMTLPLYGEVQVGSKPSSFTLVDTNFASVTVPDVAAGKKVSRYTSVRIHANAAVAACLLRH